MARKVYYGTCPASPSNNSGAGAENSTYHVYIRDIDIPAEGFQFNEGDLLVVFFGVQNKFEQPSIVTHVTDTETDVSVVDDEGKFIKTYDVEVEAVDAWGMGETVIFAYTQRGSDNSFHWALVNGVHASMDVFGDTKLWDIDMSSTDPEALVFPEWIQSAIEPPAEPTDTTTALAPNMLKKLYQLLTQNSPDGEGLIWTPSAEGTQEVLGTLKLTSDGDAVNITYPLDAIVEAVKELSPEKTHTGQLHNNGNGVGPGHETDASAPFITQYIPNEVYTEESLSVPAGLHFENGTGLNYTYLNNDQERQYIPRIILNDSNNKIAFGTSDGDTLTGIVLGKDTEVQGTLNTNNIITSTMPVEAGTTPGSAVTNVGITTNGQIQEKNQLLSERYGPLYEIEMIRHYTGTIGSNKSTAHLHPSVLTTTHPSSEWTAVGVVGFNVNYYKDAGAKADDAYYANVWECYLQNASQIEYAIFNFRNAPIKVFIDIYVLYKKKI